MHTIPIIGQSSAKGIPSELSSFSREELLDYDLAQDTIKALLKSLLEKRD